MQLSRRVLLAGAASAPLASLTASPAYAHRAGDLVVRRLGAIITADMLPPDASGNIAGPSAVATGKDVRLYFADHKGTYIRLAFADSAFGPYQVHPGGTLPLGTVAAEAARETEPLAQSYPYAHIASPDVHRLSNGHWRMYFHAAPKDPYIRWAHENGVATSTDGIEWHLENPRPLPETYLRGFQWKGEWYGVNRQGFLSHSRDGVNWDEEVVTDFAASVTTSTEYIRHVALVVEGDVLSVFYSRVGDAPERIMLATARLRGPWTSWRLRDDAVEILRPELDWEGADLPVVPTKAGSAEQPGNELRDPAILDHRGRRFLYYAFRGERGIGLAEITRR